MSAPCKEVWLPRMTPACSAKPIGRELGNVVQCWGWGGSRASPGSWVWTLAQCGAGFLPRAASGGLEPHLRTTYEVSAEQTSTASALPRISLKTLFVCVFGLAMRESRHTWRVQDGLHGHVWCVTPAFGSSKSREQGWEVDGNDLLWGKSEQARRTLGGRSSASSMQLLHTGHLGITRESAEKFLQLCPWVTPNC